MKNFLRIIWVVWMCAACSGNKNQLVITAQNFGEQIAEQQNLNFTFDREVAPVELLNQWSETAYLDIQPPVAGMFRWESTRTLVFSPEVGFAPNTDYTAFFTDEVTKIATIPETQLPKEKTIKFHTPYLGLMGVNAFWGANAQDKAELRLQMNFNYDIDPEQLKDLIAVKIAGYEIGYLIESTGIGRSIRLILKGNKAPSDLAKQKIALNIKPGLRLPGAEEVSAKAIAFETTVPSIDRFEVIQVEEIQDDDRLYIKVSTNQALGLSPDQIKRHVTLFEEGSSPTKKQMSIEIEKLDVGFLVKGNFEKDKAYGLTITKSITSIFDKNLAGNYEQKLIFGKVTPSIAFPETKASYLSSRGEQNIGIRITQLPEVNIQVFKIYENNIKHFLYHEVGYYQYSGQVGSYYSDYSQYGDLIYDQTVKTQSLAQNGDLRLIQMRDLTRLDSKPFKGIYMLRVMDPSSRWISDARLVSVSDMGFIAKATEDEVLVFVNSIIDGTPVSGAEVTLISSNNQEILKASSNSEGVARFADISQKMPGFEVAMVTAKKDEEFNYMLFRHNALDASQWSRSTLQGIQTEKGSYQAFIYGPRNLYRPGETVPLKTLVQSLDWKPVADMLIKFDLKLPNGKVMYSRKGELSKNGTLETQFELPPNAVTGAYTAEVLTSNNALIGSYNLNVEDFIPDRIKVNARLNQTAINVGEQVQFTAEALNLFGPPAANRSYEVDLWFEEADFHPAPKDPDYRDFSFALSRGAQAVYEMNSRREGKTDENGKITESFVTDASYRNIGAINGNVSVTVFDETGRPVENRQRFQLFTQNAFAGIKGLDSYWIGTNQKISFPVALLDREGRAASSQVRVVVERSEWQSVLEKDYSGSYRYVSREKVISETETTINISGRGQFNFTPNHSGYHVVKVFLPGAKACVSTSFYAYGYGAQASAFEVSKEGQIQMVLDKESYRVGDKAKVLFKTPFSGQMLVTIERDRLIEYRYVTVKERSAALEFTLTEAHLPNAYITATLIKPLKNKDLPLTVAYGIEGFGVESSGYQMPITIEAAGKSRSRKQQTVQVKAEPNAEVTVAVVDEGILQIKRYRSPDPVAYFFQPRALQVSSYNVYPRLFPEITLGQDRFGAGDYDLGQRTNPMQNNRVKPVALWSQTLTTDSKGKANYTFEIPEFSGSLRVMVVGVKGSKTGSAEHQLQVADPLVVSAGVPRFLSPGDRARIPVTIANTTDKTTEASVSLAVSGQLSSGSTPQQVSIPAQSERQVYFDVVAKETIGTGTIQAIAQTSQEKFPQTIEISIRPSTSLLKQSGSGMVEGGKSATVSLSHDFVPASAKAKLVVSKSPIVAFTKSFDALVRYPHGCVEQTVSAAFPQLYLRELAQSLGGYPEQHVQAAITKLQSMQLYDGSLSYWPGDYTPSWWGTAYATNFVMEAKKAGYQVDEQFLEGLLNYLSEQVRRKSTNDYYYFDGQGQRVVRQIADRSVFYSLYVLAMSGQKDRSTMNYYKARPELLSLDSRYLLAATYKRIGDNKSFQTLLPKAFTGERAENALGGNFYSYIRDMAIALNTLIETDPNNPQIGTLAQQLSEQLKTQPYLNTQEMAFSLLALGKVARQANQSQITATLKMNGQTIANFQGKDIVLQKSDLANNTLAIQTTGQGKLYYFWEVSGLSASGRYTEEDSYLKVRKRFFDRNGNPLTNKDFQQNDLIVVQLSLQTLNNLNRIENVVVTDMLPAGFEIENPRLSQGSAMPWIKDAASPEHYDYRDDRVNLFTTATVQPQYFYYTVRAVSTGTFRMGPVSADAMYNGAYHSYFGADEVVVR